MNPKGVSSGLDLVAMRSRGPRRRVTAPVDRYNAALVDTVPHAGTSGQQVCCLNHIRLLDPLDQFHAGRPIAVQYNLRYYSTASEALMRPSVVLLPLILLIPSALIAVSGAASESTDTGKSAFQPESDSRKSRTGNQKRREKYRGRDPENRTSDRRHAQESDGKRQGKGPVQTAS